MSHITTKAGKWGTLRTRVTEMVLREKRHLTSINEAKSSINKNFSKTP